MNEITNREDSIEFDLERVEQGFSNNRIISYKDAAQYQEAYEKSCSKAEGIKQLEDLYYRFNADFFSQNKSHSRVLNARHIEYTKRCIELIQQSSPEDIDEIKASVERISTTYWGKTKDKVPSFYSSYYKVIGDAFQNYEAIEDYSQPTNIISFPVQQVSSDYVKKVDTALQEEVPALVIIPEEA